MSNTTTQTEHYGFDIVPRSTSSMTFLDFRDKVAGEAGNFKKVDDVLFEKADLVNGKIPSTQLPDMDTFDCGTF